MAQKKVERNVFVHYNSRLRQKNMKTAKNQKEQKKYCPINLDYIFAENDSLFPWLENREKEIETINSEEENVTQFIGTSTTTQTRSAPIVEIEENSDNATESDDGGGRPGHGGGSRGGGGGGDDDGDGNDDGDTGACLGSRSETEVPSTYPYPYASSSQSQYTSGDRGKSPLIQEEGHEDEENEEAPIMEYMSQMPYGYPNQYTHLIYAQYPQAPQYGSKHSNSYSSSFDTPPPHYGYSGTSFGYPPEPPQQYGHGNNNNDEDSVTEPARHSFWW